MCAFNLHIILVKNFTLYKHIRSRFDPSYASLVLFSFFMGSCAAVLDPIPVIKGNVMRIEKGHITSKGTDETSLSITWLGTTNYEIRVGDISVVTDPFVTYKSFLQLAPLPLLSDNMDSDPELVEIVYGNLQVPNAIFIGHSHYDHMLDTVEALKLSEEWNVVPVFGSKTTKHILAGYIKEESDLTPIPPNLCGESKLLTQKHNPEVRKWSENWCLSKTLGSWKQINDFVSYRSFFAQHAPHIHEFTFWDGYYNDDLKYEPRIADDFRKGHTYIHFFQFKFQDGAQEKFFRVGIVGAGTEAPWNINEFTDKLDVLIMCVPGWENIEDNKYPGELIEALKPRIIILSHYDNFFDKHYLDPERDQEPIRLVPTAYFNEFLNHIQEKINEIEGYGDFEAIIVPGLGTTVEIKN